MRTVEAPAKRADIVDRNGQLLAYSVEADTIYAVPTEIGDPLKAAAALCGALDDCTSKDRGALADRIRKGKAFVYVRRQVSPEQARRVAELQLGGVGFLKENRRFYPNKSMAAHVLGHVGIDNVGLGGIEASYDSTIKGRPGTVLIHVDAKRRAFSRTERKPTTGATLELTIDEQVQYIVERELREGVRVEWRGRCIGRGDGSVHRRAAGDGQLPDVQPQRLSPVDRSRPAQPRHPGSVRAGLDLQDHHRQRGAGRARREAARPDRRQPRLHQVRQPRHPRRPPLQHAELRGRGGVLEQCRRDQGRAAARPRPVHPLRARLRLRRPAVARLPRRESRASSGTRRR